MRDSSTIRAAREAADGLRDLARDDGQSIGDEILVMCGSCAYRTLRRSILAARAADAPQRRTGKLKPA